jgi:hypothetical protein
LFLFSKYYRRAVSYFGYLTLAYDFGALGSAPGDLRQILEGRSTTKVVLFPDSLPNFPLLLTLIPFLHSYMSAFAGICDSPDEQHATHLPHPPFLVGDFICS